MPLPRRVTLLDLLAVLLAVGAGLTGLVVWDHGTVNLGLTLEYRDGRLRIHDVTPDGNAHRRYLYPGVPLIDLITVDASPIERGPSLRQLADESTGIEGHFEDEDLWGELLFSFGDSVAIGPDHRIPVEEVPPSRIASVVAGEFDPHWGIGYIGMIERAEAEYELRQSIGIAAIGLLLGALLWRLLRHGVAGDVGRRSALIVGAAVSTPFLILPAVQVGTPAGLAAGYLIPAAGALLLGTRVAGEHHDAQWTHTARAACLIAAALTAVVVLRYLTGPSLASQDRGSILLLIAAIAAIPAVIAATTTPRPTRDRVSLVALGLMPAAAATLFASNDLSAVMPIGLVGGLLAVPLVARGAPRLAPARDVGQRMRRWSAELRARAATTSVAPPDPAMTATRDLLVYGLIGTSAVISLAMPVGGPLGGPNSPLAVGGGGLPIVAGIGLAAAVGISVRRGFLGEVWTDAAVPLAAAVSVPVLLVNGLSYYGRTPFAVVPTALAALAVAHVLAVRHPDAGWRARLFAASAALVGLIALLSLGNIESVATVLIGLVALIPGMIAFADESGEPRALRSRLETLAVALTPGFGATMLVPSIGLVLLAGWLVGIVIWRQFTLNPLLGLAERSQVQRDVAVAAAETERARLAADLHDDALQQLTMLVRTLDEGGQQQAADEAREIATKLRSVVGDLRLPILDDLGAGAALEWLVERVEPLAGGPVKLERSDESRPPANVELAVFRVAQEALTNAIKHGRPPIAVRYDVRTDGRVTLAIDDAGTGIGPEAADEAPKAGHFGLVNMQQRAEQIGALLDVRRWPAGGTRVALEWRPQ